MKKQLLLPIILNATIIAMCVRYYVVGVRLDVLLPSFATSMVVVNLMIYLVRRNITRRKE